jgi:hypothetical protein
LYSAETNVRAKFEPLRASMKNGFPVRIPPAYHTPISSSPDVLQVSGAVDRRLHFTMNFRIWWGVLLLQLVIIFIMYRYEMSFLPVL